MFNKSPAVLVLTGCEGDGVENKTKSTKGGVEILGDAEDRSGNGWVHSLTISGWLDGAEVLRWWQGGNTSVSSGLSLG